MSRRRLVQLSCAVAAVVPLIVLVLFIHAYAGPFPVSDEWDWCLENAVAAKVGELKIADLFEMTGGGHRTVFTHLLSAVFARYLDWRTDLAAMVNPLLALLNLLIIVALFRRHVERSTLAYVMVVPSSMLVFSVFQHTNWTMFWQSAWQFVNLFLLLGVMVLARRRRGWGALLLAAGCAWCATFSRGHGFVVWPALVPLIWARGYRWYQHLVWIALGALAVASYFRGGHITVGTKQDTWSSVDLSAPFYVLHSGLAQIGSSMGVDIYAVAVSVALFGIALWVLNERYLRGRGWSSDRLSVWQALAAFALLTAALISASRREVYDTLALWGGYTTTAILAWIGLLAMAIPATSLIFRDGNATRAQRALGWVNVVAALILVPLYLQTNAGILDEWETYYDGPIGFAVSPHVEAAANCIQRYPFTGDRSCFCEEVLYTIDESGSRVFQLASCGFSPFSSIGPESVLPEDYVDGSPVIVGVSSVDAGLYARDWMLAGVPEELVLYLVPRAESETRLCTVRPLRNVMVVPAPQRLAEIAESASASGALWYLTTQGVESDALVVDQLTALGFRPVEVDPGGERYRDSGCRLLRFSRGR